MWKYIIDDFKTFLKVEKSLTQNSIDAYITDMSKLTQFFEITQPNIKLGEVTTKHLRSFINWLNELNITATTQARIISGIKAFFKYLVYEEIIEDSPADLIDAPKRGRKIPEILAIEEIINMITAIDLTKQEGYRNTAIIETLYGCGLRVSELTELKISNLFFDMEFIKVKGKGEEERLVPICKEAMQAINKYMKETRQKQKPKDGNEDYLFLNRRGSKLSRVMIFNIVKQIGKQAEIKKNISPHTFRHSFASHLVESGADLRAVQEMLGHASILTTEIYTHLDKEYLRTAINDFHPRSKNSC